MPFGYGTSQGHSDDDVLIAVMGGTGTGKSSFIRLLSGDTNVHVGDSLMSQTSDIQVVPFFEARSGRNVVLVDMPGFDDSRPGVTDTDALKKITAFLIKQYDEKRKLNGLVYLQRISDSRFSGQSSRNLKMFKGLCGGKASENIVVLTTFWDCLTSEEEGIQREAELKSVFFNELVKGDVLGHIFMLLPTDVLIQKEMRVEGKTLEVTTAGSVHSNEIVRLIARHKKEMEDLLEEMKTIDNSESVELQQVLDRVKEQLKKQEAEMLALKEGLDQARMDRENMKWQFDAQKKLYDRWAAKRDKPDKRLRTLLDERIQARWKFSLRAQYPR